MKNIICIYHGHCADGFGAAWAVHQSLGDEIEYFAASYNKPPPDVEGKVVIMVDFSYKKDQLEIMGRAAQSILILDHHKSAQEDLAEYPEPPGDSGNFRGWLPDSGIYARFDMNKSGAVLAWEHFNEGDPPRLLMHVQDRDLWRFDLHGTKEIIAALFSYDWTFAKWTAFIDTPHRTSELKEEGMTLIRNQAKNVNALIEKCKRFMTIDGYCIPVASIPFMMASDAGHEMSKGYDFAACYWDDEDGREFSLRSSKAGIDVSILATKFGGGGHKNAAGFKVPRHHPLAQA